MTATFIKSGNRITVSSSEATEAFEVLPVGTYTVKFNPMAGQYYLETIDGFELPAKLYGDTTKHSERILNTFKDRPNSTGVMLSGEKGSGKTLLAKTLSLDAQKDGIPTIVINQPHHGEEFNSFMQTIEQPLVVIFDEFEKVYDNDDQEKMLTLLDGVYPSKKLFVLTTNDKYRVNAHMRNRPGRIFYRIDYTGLDNAFIVEYCEDNLKNKSHIESICRVAIMFSEFNFDILKALVEEMNRYDEAPQDALKVLNAKPENHDTARFAVGLQVGGAPVTGESLHTKEWRGNPLTEDIEIYINTSRFDEDGDIIFDSFNFEPSELQMLDPATGEFKFTDGDGNRLSLAKIQTPTTYNWDMIG